MINFVSSSVSVILIALAIVISALYPNNPSVHQFAIALFLWFLALGALRWIENRISPFVEADSWADYLWSYTFLFSELGLIIAGIVLFVYGLA